MYRKYVALREQKGVNDFTVSKETGLRTSLFSEWKSGRSKPKVDKLMILANYFNVPLEYFLKED